VKTDELISLLASGEEAVDTRTPRRAGALALLAGLAVSLAVMAVALGVRSNLAEEAHWPQFWTREAFCAALAGIGLVCVRRLSVPGARLGLAPLALAVPVAAMWLLAGAALVEAEPAQRMALVLGQTARVCALLIAVVAAPVFVAVIWALRCFAPTRLRLAGAAAGLAAGGAGALVYSLHCPELAPPFLAVWYVLGMLIPVAVGALLGPRLLRW
jgi:hypothetical protein